MLSKLVSFDFEIKYFSLVSVARDVCKRLVEEAMSRRRCFRVPAFMCACVCSSV